MGLCRAQRLESPKAARQVQLLQSVMLCFVSHRSSHFKLHSSSPSSLLDWWVSLPPPCCLQALLLFYLIFLFHLGLYALSISVPLVSLSFSLFLFVSRDVCNTSLAIYALTGFPMVEFGLCSVGHTTTKTKTFLFCLKEFSWNPNVFVLQENVYNISNTNVLSK